MYWGRSANSAAISARRIRIIESRGSVYRAAAAIRPTASPALIYVCRPMAATSRLILPNPAGSEPSLGRTLKGVPAGPRLHRR